MKTLEKIKQGSTKRKWENRSSVRLVVVLFLTLHIGFYLSGYIPDNSSYTTSPFRVPQNLSEYKTVTLIRWDYSPGEETMEVVFDLTNYVYSEGNIEYQAVYDRKKVLDSQIVYDKNNTLIIQLYGIPEKEGKRVAITFETTPEGEKTYEVGFYNYTGIVNEVDSLPIRSEKEYTLQRIEDDITYYQGKIAELSDIIQKNEATVENIRQDIANLQGNTANLTTDELLNLEKTIENDQTTIEELQGRNEECKKQIAEYEDMIQVFEKRRGENELAN